MTTSKKTAASKKAAPKKVTEKTASPKRPPRKKVTKTAEDEAANTAAIESESIIPQVEPITEQKEEKPAVIEAAPPPDVIEIAPVSEPDNAPFTITLPEPSQPGEEVTPKQLPIDNFSPLLPSEPADGEVLPEPLQEEPEHHHKPADIWGAIKTHWFIWALTAMLFVIMALGALGVIRAIKARNARKQAQRTEQKIKADKDSLAQTKESIEVKHARVDANLEDAATKFNQAFTEWKEFHATMPLNNAEYKKENDETKALIRDSATSNDAKRRLIRKLATED